MEGDWYFHLLFLLVLGQAEILEQTIPFSNILILVLLLRHSEGKKRGRKSKQSFSALAKGWFQSKKPFITFKQLSNNNTYSNVIMNTTTRHPHHQNSLELTAFSSTSDVSFHHPHIFILFAKISAKR